MVNSRRITITKPSLHATLVFYHIELIFSLELLLTSNLAVLKLLLPVFLFGKIIRNPVQLKKQTSLTV